MNLTQPFFIIGPCVIETPEIMQEIAEFVSDLQKEYPAAQFIFKASFDKANRTSITSHRGPGITEGLQILADIKQKYQLPVTTDIHESWHAKPAGEVCDLLQIPAFLCRQTDLLVEAANTGKIINIKKAQFLSGQDMQYPAEKVKASGNQNIILTERGTSFGYNNLVVDFRNIADMVALGYPVCMDATHSVQRPGGAGGKSSGNREFVPAMAKAAKAFGASGWFFETHPDPANAKSDGPNMIEMDVLKQLIPELM